jgi:hypothetical protein
MRAEEAAVKAEEAEERVREMGEELLQRQEYFRRS